MPTAATETVITTSVKRNGLIARQGAQSGALIAPMPASLPSGSTVVAATVYEYNSAQDAIDDWGDGSKIAVGVEAALHHLPKIKAIGVAPLSGSPFTETFGAASAISAGTLTAANLPLTSITSVTVDGAATQAADIILTGETPSTLTVAAGKIAINPSTGAFKLGTPTSGASSGCVIVYVAHDWDPALEQLNKQGFEFLTVPGTPFEGASFGLYKKLVDFAGAERKKVATALPSGAKPAVRDPTGHLCPTIKAIRSKDIKYIASKSYDGDLTSAYMAWTAAMAPDGTSKEQDAPLGVTYNDGYAFVEFGGEVTPSTGTWHEIGVNAIYKTPGDAYIQTNDRAGVNLTDFYRFFGTGRVVRVVSNEMDEDLLALRRSSPTGIPYDDAGLNAVRATMRASLQRQVDRGYLTAFTVFVPSLASTSAEDRQLRRLPGITYGVVIRGQVHLLELTQEVSF